MNEESIERHSIPFTAKDVINLEAKKWTDVNGPARDRYLEVLNSDSEQVTEVMDYLNEIYRIKYPSLKENLTKDELIEMLESGRKLDLDE